MNASAAVAEAAVAAAAAAVATAAVLCRSEAAGTQDAKRAGQPQGATRTSQRPLHCPVEVAAAAAVHRGASTMVAS